MIKIIKNLFSKTKEKVNAPDAPGRTFKRVLTGRYFGCEDLSASEEKTRQEKQDKIDQIDELELLPMFVRYTYANHQENDEKKILSAHVAFQKEVLAEKWNMIHVTEISFTVNAEDFEEFEKMAAVSITKDFRDVTPNNEKSDYNGEERRKEKRDT